MAPNENGVTALMNEFAAACEPLESGDKLLRLIDERTGAHYCECHIQGSKLIELGTTDVPLDPEEPEYRANRDIMEDDVAFQQMKDDALLKRSFSNIVAEWTKDQDAKRPLKIIGGQHRFIAIKEALAKRVDVWQGIKVYFALDMQQRYDVQLISNTNIDISGDWIDRVQESFKGPELRNWCQLVGLLPAGKDFGSIYHRGGRITVRFARTFILNYFDGTKVKTEKFKETSTTPTLSPSGGQDTRWEEFKDSKSYLWTDAKLITAAREYVALMQAQRNAFKGKKNVKADFADKALNNAVMAAWAYVAGMLRNNPTRLKHHFDLRSSIGKDPLNAAALAKGKHKSDKENYRGLGYRTDAKERGRLVELFSLQAENGEG
ncbi:MAG: hypothetical protein WAM04_08140, partial [Candidatus Sulfotelmatobacter sp.]